VAGGPVSPYRLREATVADAAILVRQRWSMFEELGDGVEGERADLEEAIARYLAEAMPAGLFRAWLVEADGEAVAGGGMQLRPLVPRPGYTRGEAEAIVLSVWTDPPHRRRGLARQVVVAILDWCRANGVRRVCLHASPDGRTLYEQLGFRATNEMRVDLPAQ
jgi:GNAT superfamily N-acetyltransferase